MDVKDLRLGKWLAVLLCGVLVILGGIAFANYKLNPLIFSKAEQVAVAETLMSGSNVMIVDSNIDWRGIRREHIQRMNYTPEVLIFGGSRWQEATSDALPDKKMYTAFAQNDHLEDMMALTELLYSAKRMPRTLVLSVRFATFELLDKRVAWWWKTLAPEYLAMGRRLEVETRPWWEWMPYEKWQSLFSMELLMAKAEQYSKHHLTWRPATELHHDQYDITGVDGALRFSANRLKKESGANAEAAATAKGKKDAKGRLTIDRKLLAQLPVLLKFLRDQGVQVVFAQTPFHPAYYDQIKDTDYYRDLMQIETELKNVAGAAGLQVIGGFDAKEVGCAPEQFRDFNHGDSACLASILRQIKFAANGAAQASAK